MPPVVIRDEQVDVAAIQEAIRERVALIARAELRVAAREAEAANEARLRPLADWDFPAELWRAMWPPELVEWNLDRDFAIRSHREGLPGRALVLVKTAWRAVLRVLGRPLVTRQVEVNRALALMVHALAREATESRLHIRALERRLGRASAAARESRGEIPPLLVFADEPASEDRR